MNLLVGFVHFYLCPDLDTVTLLHPTKGQYGEGPTGHLQGQDMVRSV